MGNGMEGRTLEHIVTDCESNRTFCLTVEQGALISLQEQVPCLRFPHTETRWVQVDKLDADGADWWEQWEGEVRAGQFN